MVVKDSRSQRPRLRWLVAGILGVVVVCGCVSLLAAAGLGFVLFPLRPTVIPQRAVAYILDTSARMQLLAAGGHGQSRLAVAEAALAEVIRPSDPSLNAGLRVFGNGTNTVACKDTKLVVPFAPSNQSQIATEFASLTTGSTGDAALAEAMLNGIRDLKTYTGSQWLVVVTGGVDSCNADSGQLIAQAARQAGITLEMFVIGYELSAADTQAVKSMVSPSSGGQFLAAADATALRSVLGAVQNYINSPSALLKTAIAVAATPPATPTSTLPAATTTPGPTAQPTPPVEPATSAPFPTAALPTPAPS